MKKSGGTAKASSAAAERKTAAGVTGKENPETENTTSNSVIDGNKTTNSEDPGSGSNTVIPRASTASPAGNGDVSVNVRMSDDDSSSSSSSGYYTCPTCSSEVPLVNKVLHSIRCKGPAGSGSKQTRAATTPSLEQEEKADKKQEPEVPVALPVDGGIVDKALDSITTVGEESTGNWFCQHCSYENVAKHRYCNMCSMPSFSDPTTTNAPTSTEHDTGVASSSNALVSVDQQSNMTSRGAWVCSVCTLANARRLQHCVACGTVRPPDGVVRERLIDDDDLEDDDYEDSDADERRPGRLRKPGANSSLMHVFFVRPVQNLLYRWSTSRFPLTPTSALVAAIAGVCAHRYRTLRLVPSPVTSANVSIDSKSLSVLNNNSRRPAGASSSLSSSSASSVHSVLAAGVLGVGYYAVAGLLVDLLFGQPSG
jgi:predicted nucleic acid-binding Zn ribbon protein